MNNDMYLYHLTQRKFNELTTGTGIENWENLKRHFGKDFWSFHLTDLEHDLGWSVNRLNEPEFCLNLETLEEDLLDYLFIDDMVDWFGKELVIENYKGIVS